jgi:hypothetical protein
MNDSKMMMLPQTPRIPHRDKLADLRASLDNGGGGE